MWLTALQLQIDYDVTPHPYILNEQQCEQLLGQSSPLLIILHKPREKPQFTCQRGGWHIQFSYLAQATAGEDGETLCPAKDNTKKAALTFFSNILLLSSCSTHGHQEINCVVCSSRKREYSVTTSLVYMFLLLLNWFSWFRFLLCWGCTCMVLFKMQWWMQQHQQQPNSSTHHTCTGSTGDDVARVPVAGSGYNSGALSSRKLHKKNICKLFFLLPFFFANP